MNDHLSDPKITMFQARALPSTEMMAALEHLAQCIRCRQRSHEYFQATNAYLSSTITLFPAFQWQHEHLNSEQVMALVNKSLDREDEEIAQAHLQTCRLCRAELQSQLSFQEELKTELRTRYGPKPKQSWQWQLPWLGWRWKPLFATLFGAACVLATVVFIQKQAHRKAPSPIVAAIPSATASVIKPSPSFSPTTPPTGSEPEETVIASLHDRAGMIAITSAGNLEGIPSVADELRGDIVTALRTGKLNKPALLNDLASDVGTVRGKAADGTPSQLLTPVSITVLANRPVLHWQPVEKAIGYEVQIADGRGNEVAHSELIPASNNRWQPPQALKRGAIYTWTVRAVHEEPTTTAVPPTGRFKVLEATQARELVRLKARTNSHLVLGMFYARAGMLAEAKQELKLLAKKNPDSPLARKLLQTVQSWR